MNYSDVGVTYLEASPEPIMILTSEEIVFANEAAHDLIDLKRDASLRGRDVGELVVPAEREAVHETIQRVLAEGAETNRSHYRIRTATGETRHIEATGRRVMWNDQPAILVIVHDVTERVTREEQLTALHEATRAFVQATTPGEVAEQAVAAARDILGYGYSSIHSYDPEQDALPLLAVTNDLHEVIDPIPEFGPGEGIAGRVFVAGQSVLVEDTHGDPDVLNPETEFRTELYVPLGEYGLFIACVPEVAGIDESERQLLELLAANTEVALKEITYQEELKEREATLEAQNKRLEKFASLVSHDLRNPLNIADGYFELITETGNLDHLDRIRHALNRMETVIQDMRFLTRQSDTATNLEAVTLDRAVKDAWAMIDDSNEAATLTISDDLGRIRADESYLRQLLENLFRNAIDHAGPDVAITVSSLDDGFAVSDDGPGIPTEEREQVFEHSYTTSETGTGLGLYIVTEIADASEWSVAVSESETGGACFEIHGVDPV